MSGDIYKWLKSLGLSKYQELFTRNKIDLDILKDITERDLQELGIPLGDRKRLIKSVGLVPKHVEVNAGRFSSLAPSSMAERRRLTVMFCDLVGSTAISTRLDPEDMREVLSDYQQICTSAVEHYGGYVAKYMGDGVLCYFGWPTAHEDDAERAVRAGLSFLQKITSNILPNGETLSARVGVATGLVVVGDLIGEGASQEQAVVGETPNLASRLQGLAEPGSMVIAPGTSRLIGELFELIDLGEHKLEGIPGPVQAWKVIGESQTESRFKALRGDSLVPLIGRNEEIDLLLARWQRAKEGEGQVVQVTGEPGIGKSRIVQTLLDQIASDPHTKLCYYCSSIHIGSAFHPVISQLEYEAKFLASDTNEVKLDKLESLLSGKSKNVIETVPLFAELLSIPVGERFRSPDSSLLELKTKIFEELLVQLEGLAADIPLLIVLEDAHWLDPTTSEFFELVIERLQNLPVLLLITYRPEFIPPWTGYAAPLTVLTISRLSKNLSGRMIEKVAGHLNLPDQITQQIISKTDGVPLFVEELTKAIMESQPLSDKESSNGSIHPQSEFAIPATLHDSLLARLDRLGSAKEVAQIGSAIGRKFEYKLLSAVSTLEDQQLFDALANLVDSELVYSRGHPPHSTYTFKHALIQDAAYQSLLKNRRKVLHKQIVKVIEEKFPETKLAQPEILAHHCSCASLTEKAVVYWMKAGERSIQRSANSEAVGHLNQALKALETLPRTTDRAQTELEVQTSLGVALAATDGPGARRTRQTYERAYELCQEMPQSPIHFAAHWGIWRSTEGQREADKHAEFMLEIAQNYDDDDLRLVAHHAKWATVCYNEPSACPVHVERGLAHYSSAKHKSLAFLYGGHDPAVCGLGHHALALWLLGYPDQAAKHAIEAVSHARSLSHPPSLAHSLHLVTLCYFCMRDYDMLQRRAHELMDLSEEQGFPEYYGHSMVSRGWLMAKDGKFEDALECLEKGMEASLTATRGWNIPYLMSVKADVLKSANHFLEAAKVLEAAKTKGRKIGIRIWEPEIERLEGECVLMSPEMHTKSAMTHLINAMNIARLKQAKSFEMRAVNSLVIVLQKQGEVEKAREIIAPVYDWFTEGFGTTDLKTAKDLLDQLG